MRQNFQKFDGDDQLITDKAVAKAFSIDRSTVWRWAEKGLIPKPVVNRHKFSRWSKNEIQPKIAQMRDAKRRNEMT